MSIWNVKQPAGQPAGASPASAEAALPVEAGQAEADRKLRLKVSIHRDLLGKINLAALDQLSREQIHRDIADIVTEQLQAQGEPLNGQERAALVDEVLDELLGLGPLEPLLKDDTITDILVNGANSVFVERRGLLEKVSTRFQDDRHLLRIIQKIVSAVGRRIDESSPYVDARLADGSRVNAIIPPLAIDGPMLSIRLRWACALAWCCRCWWFQSRRRPSASGSRNSSPWRWTCSCGRCVPVTRCHPRSIC